MAVREEATTFVGALGACVSPQAAVEAVTRARVERLPAASAASTSKVKAVPQASAVTVAPGWVGFETALPFTYTR